MVIDMSAVDDAAAVWAVRMNLRDLAPEEGKELGEWLAADPRHRGALLRARAASYLLATDEPGEALVSAPAEPKFAAPPPAGRRWKISAAAAAIAAGMALLLVLPFAGNDYRTTIGEMRRVALQDGSVAMINTDSEVRVTFAKDERSIGLEKGEAWFQVAKDSHRPFVVDAGEVRVRATGTAFSVRRRGDDTQVIVTEGRVLAWREADNATPVPISAGQQALIASRVATPISAAAADEAPLAWREGGIVLHGMTVSEAAAEFNRYNRTKIVIHAPLIGMQRMTGYFRIDQVDAFARAVAKVTGGNMHSSSNRIEINPS